VSYLQQIESEIRDSMEREGCDTEDPFEEMIEWITDRLQWMDENMPTCRPSSASDGNQNSTIFFQPKKN